MKMRLAFLFIALFSSVSFSQADQEKERWLSIREINDRIIKREFPDVPQAVRDCHGTGILHLYIKVDRDGIIKSAMLFNGICHAVNEYLEKTVLNWKFKPLTVDEKKVPFRGVIEVPFCYGAFHGCYKSS